MKILLLTTTAILGAIVVAAFGPSPSQSQSTQSAEPEVALLPVVRVDAKTDMAIEFDVRNTSSKPMRYLLGDRLPRSVAALQILLFRGDRFIPTRETPEPPMAVPERVRTLKPGEAIPYRILLADEYGQLEPGRYELRAEYSVREGTTLTRIGVTPMRFRRTIMQIEVGGENAKKGSGKNN